MDDKTRDELLLAVVEAVAQLGRVVTMPLSNSTETWMAFDRLGTAIARAKAKNTVRAANEVIEATEQSEC